MKMTTAVEAWGGFWGARTPREKVLLTWGGAIVGAVIVYSMLWAPAQQGRAELRETLPAMQRQLAQMTAEADEARSLAAAAQGAAPTGNALKEALLASLTQDGFAAPQVQLTGDAVRIDLKNASFPAWTMWLDDARRQFKVQVSEAHATALKADGQVDVSASLRPSLAGASPR
ncbi:type II secretion system protein M [Trinickia caryophylli]|uniref:General secretion pathway protein M n=1 Tax=Trinickia caryophylli TaxID=28094 RepID=A0A1X7HA91_TRICW|nr:type II secretion system protein M [Trinickia caryophylli]PMS08738.1 type II secretion system protein M [Trinickia caryophylli]TRX19018.1 type II secretion system protein M [Trinickia caryophylli]WQE10183.1 type II secretion system protein M [Trinickia caryophylli]SMF82669.1 general secretion pathway protein M [Trinickia caryophylli]GLU35855.1 general secretory pathway protein GspM [Trinickia caryophylli]